MSIWHDELSRSFGVSKGPLGTKTLGPLLRRSMLLLRHSDFDRLKVVAGLGFWGGPHFQLLHLEQIVAIAAVESAQIVSRHRGDDHDDIGAKRSSTPWMIPQGIDVVPGRAWQVSLYTSTITIPNGAFPNETVAPYGRN